MSEANGSVPLDTTREVHDRQVDRWRRMRPEEKAALVETLSADSTAMALAGIRRQFPGGDVDEIRELVARRYGRSFAREVYGHRR